MKIRLLALFVILALLLSGCLINVTNGSGRMLTETRKVSGFNALDFSGLGEVIIVQGQTEALKIEAEDNIMPHIVTEVKNGTLLIHMDRQSWQNIIKPTRIIHYELAVKNLNNILISGLGSIKAAELKTDRLTARMSGAGLIQVGNLQASEAAVTLSGAGGITLTGKVNTQDATLSGMGSYNGADLESQNAKIVISGGGNARVWAIASLYVRLSGAGSVSYYGSPKITKEVTGIGILSSLGAK